MTYDDYRDRKRRLRLYAEEFIISVVLSLLLVLAYVFLR